MELRSCNHLHFVQAIKDGLVIKLLNVTHGRPVLKFKKIGEIYEAGEAKHDDSVPRPWSKDGLFFDPNRVKLESQLLPLADRSTIISDCDTSDSNCSTSDDERSSDLDDISFFNTTLQQIKENCKARKRKHVRHVSPSKELSENCLLLKRDSIKLEPEEDEDDLEQPLSNWKLKISKNKKLKKKCTSNDMLTSSQSTIALVKSEPFPNDQNILQPFGDLPTPIDATVEVNEPNPFDCQITTLVAADSSFDFNEQVHSCEVVTDEVVVAASECDLETDVSMSSTEEQCCVVNKASYERMECANPESVHDVEVSGWEIVNVHCPEIISYNFPDFPVAEFENERYINYPLLDIIPPQPISVIKDHNSYMYDISHSYSSINLITWPSSNDDRVRGLDTDIDNRLQCTEILEVDGLCMLQDGTKDDLPFHQEASTISPSSDHVIDNKLQCMEIIDVDDEVLIENCTTNDFPSYQEASTSSPFSDCGFSQSSNSCLSPDKPSVSVAEVSPLAEDQQLPLSVCAYAVRNCSTAIQAFDATEELTTPSDDGNHQLSKPVCHPERLFSTRKVISPTSQERLRKALQTNDLPDEEHSGCRGKLWFGKQTENTVVKAEGCYKIRRAGATNNMKQVPWKPKYDKKGSPSKGILKGHHSSAVPSLSTRCTSSGSLSQSAIAFSQRQMQDIESLATKLTGELSSMKDVVNELLHHETSPDMSLKHNMDKVTMAIKNATKAEETARRWLSIMARDCNRFCKIMNLTERGSTASGNVVLKDRKKITFADEVGGKLCHVKIFNDDLDSKHESSDIEK